MPFKSEKQRRWMWANEPEMAERWEREERKQGGRHRVRRRERPKRKRARVVRKT